MRAAVVQFNAIGTRILNLANNVVPYVALGFHHRRNDNGAVGPGTFHFRNFTQIHFQGPVGDQFDVIDRQHLLPAKMPCAVAIGNIQHRRANGFPDRTAPPCFKGPMDLHPSIAGRRGRQPKRIGRPNTGKIDAEVSHGPSTFHESLEPPACHPARPSRWMRPRVRGCSLRRRIAPADWFRTARSPE